MSSRQFRIGLFAGAVIAGIGTVSAQESMAPGYDDKGFYARLDAGWGVAGNAKATGATISGQADDLNDSPIVSAGIGYRFNKHLRADLTSGYASSFRLDDQDGAGNTWRSDLSAWTTLVNVYFEYPRGSWSPYLTAGAGISRNTLGQVTDSNGSATLGGKTSTSFAWQAGAGLAVATTPDWSLDFGYRYLDAGEFKSATAAAGTVTGDLKSHIVMAGLRYSFAVPKPAPTPVAMRPPPAPTPPPAAAPMPMAAPPPPTGPELPVTYMIFFEWDKAEISSGSQQVVRQAAGTAKRVPVTRIVATGHADRSGTDRYNMALSIRRATAVKDELMREGVPESQIVIIGKGEREPLVPTSDGVREPQNRRVEIVVQ